MTTRLTTAGGEATPPRTAIAGQAERIEAGRLAHGWTRTQLCVNAGIQKQHYAMILRKGGHSYVQRISKALGVKVEWLTTGAYPPLWYTPQLEDAARTSLDTSAARRMRGSTHPLKPAVVRPSFSAFAPKAGQTIEDAAGATPSPQPEAALTPGVVSTPADTADAKPASASPHAAPVRRPARTGGGSTPQAIHIPLLGTVTVGQGWSDPAETPSAAATVTIPAHWRAVRIRGRSGYPVVWDGQVVLVDEHVEPKHNQLVVVQTADRRAYLRRYCLCPDVPAGFVLASINIGRDSFALPAGAATRIAVVMGVLFTDQPDD